MIVKVRVANTSCIDKILFGGEREINTEKHRIFGRIFSEV